MLCVAHIILNLYQVSAKGMEQEVLLYVNSDNYEVRWPWDANIATEICRWPYAYQLTLERSPVHDQKNYRDNMRNGD